MTDIETAARALLCALDDPRPNGDAFQLTKAAWLSIDAIRAALSGPAAIPATGDKAVGSTLRHALAQLTDDERAVLPLNVQEDARHRVSLAHIESGETAIGGQGVAVVSVPKKYARLAWAMVCAINEATVSPPRHAEVDGRMTCPKCRGEGGERWHEADGSENGEKCDKCDGRGYLYVQPRHAEVDALKALLGEAGDEIQRWYERSPCPESDYPTAIMDRIGNALKEAT